MVGSVGHSGDGFCSQDLVAVSVTSLLLRSSCFFVVVYMCIQYTVVVWCICNMPNNFCFWLNSVHLTVSS